MRRECEKDNGRREKMRAVRVVVNPTTIIFLKKATNIPSLFSSFSRKNCREFCSDRCARGDDARYKPLYCAVVRIESNAVQLSNALERLTGQLL